MKGKQKTNNPKAVVISDIHYSLATLELADTSLRMAMDKAEELNIPLIIAGDLHDTKANLRAECVNRLIKTFSYAYDDLGLNIWLLRGNHDALHEKSTDHALKFLSPYCSIVSYPCNMIGTDLCLIPYYHDPEELKTYLSTLPEESTLIMHQGCSDSNSGHYIQDKSALPKDAFANFRVISGHYHTRQDIKCGRPRGNAIGLFSYIGNPYTLNYAEANDPAKGFQILHTNGLLEFVPTNLRKHLVLDLTLFDIEEGPLQKSPLLDMIAPDDLLWVKIRGTQEELVTVTKPRIAEIFGLTMPFRLDLIPDEVATVTPLKSLSNPEMLDGLIDSLSNTSEERKVRLKTLWRGNL